MPYADIEKQRENARKWAAENREKRYESSRKRRLENREWFNSLKDKPCVDCGNEYHPIVMDFHHRDKTVKLYTPSQALARTSRIKVLEEIAKCDLLCSNCHRLRHVEDGDWGQSLS